MLTLRQGSEVADATAPHVSFRLVIQTSQCGSLIGKGGAKIKEIREVGTLPVCGSSPVQLFPPHTEYRSLHPGEHMSIYMYMFAGHKSTQLLTKLTRVCLPSLYYIGCRGNPA